MEIEAETETCTYVHSFQKVDKTKGKYKSAGAVIESYGFHCDRKAAIEAGMNYCKAAVALGGQWSSYEPMAKVLEIFHLERSSIQLMQEAWEQKTDYDKKADRVIASKGQGQGESEGQG